MNGNPFYVEPANPSQALAGLGAIAGQYRERKKSEEIKAALSDAYRSGDPNKMAEMAIQYPEARETLQSLYGFKNEQTKRNALDTYKAVLSNKQSPQAALEAINQRIAFVESQGGDPSTVSVKARDQLQQIIESGQDPSAFFKAAEMEYAGIASPQEWNAYSSMSGADTGRIGQYNPGDYTPESWSKFVSSRDPSVLKRYESERVIDIGGVKHVYNQTTGSATPLSSVENEASGQAKIAAEIAAAKADAQAKVAKSAKDAAQSGKLDDANRLYKNLGDADLDLIYGKGEKWYPEFFRSQKGIDLIAQRDQLVGMLNLAARGQLQGQGAVSDTEAKAILQSATTLADPNISPTLAREALNSAMESIYRGAGKDFEGGSGKGAMTPTTAPTNNTVNWNDLP